MRSVPASLIVSTVLASATLSGCMRPYSPYSPYGYPMGSPTIPTLTPGAPYAPGGLPTYPDSGLGQPTPISPNSTFAPGSDSGGDAPFFSPGSASKSPYEGGGIPKYDDAGIDGNFQMPHPSNTADGTNVNEYGSVEGAGASVSSAAKVPNEHADFHEPVVVQLDPSPSQMTPLDHAPPAAFAHDAEGYQWVRGVLQHGPEQNQWSIIYRPRPDASDPFQGRLTLQDHPRFQELGDQSVVTIHGTLDTSAADSQGRPTYRVESVNAFEANPIP